MQWEATAFGRPVLAIVLVASLALFPVVLIPSGPSMWLAGMIFGYGLGFVIIMIGTTIGMVLPYMIGLLFRDRIHVRSSIGFKGLSTTEKWNWNMLINLQSWVFNLLVCYECAAMVKKMASESCNDQACWGRELVSSISSGCDF